MKVLRVYNAKTMNPESNLNMPNNNNSMDWNLILIMQIFQNKISSNINMSKARTRNLQNLHILALTIEDKTIKDNVMDIPKLCEHKNIAQYATANN